MLTILAAVALGGIATCDLEHAIYRQRTMPSITARFRDVDSAPDWPMDIALEIHVSTSGKTYWFVPWLPGTSGQQRWASTTDISAQGWRAPSADGGADRPFGDVSYVGTDDEYNILDEVPAKGRRAPAHFFIPDLVEALWYNARDTRDARQFFDLVACEEKR